MKGKQIILNDTRVINRIAPIKHTGHCIESFELAYHFIKMAMVTLNKFCKRIIKSSVQLQVRFQQTKVKPNRTLSYNDVVPVFRKGPEFVEKVALRDTIASYTYGNIFLAAKELSEDVTEMLACKTEERVMFLCPNDASYVITQWAIWMSGNIGK